MHEHLPITLIIGPPGVGKTTLMNHVNSTGFYCKDGDEFISHLGRTHLSDGSWNNYDRLSYIVSMANFANEYSSQIPLVLVDAMTKQWMRDLFIRSIDTTISIAWIHITREFAPGEAQKLVDFRASQGHPITDLKVFERFHHEFDPLSEPHLKLINPGATKPISDFHVQINSVLNKIYAH